ncbi:bark storage protein A [Tanacetum coccineum]
MAWLVILTSNAITRCGGQAIGGAMNLCSKSIQCGDCMISKSLLKEIGSVNKVGSYIGVVVPNGFEMNLLLQSSSFVTSEKRPYVDISGRRFQIRTIENQRVIVVMTGLGMLNAGITTQLLLSLFNVKGVLHFGIAGNANNVLEIGDVTIPKFWAHTGLWLWQRNGGREDELPLESNGDYTRSIGYLKFSDYNDTATQNKEYFKDNLLNRVWYQPEEVFPINTTPETRQHAFWGMKLEQYNGAYRAFLSTKFNVTPIDMESAAVALTCYQQEVPFIAIRALSDLAGGGSEVSNEASNFAPLAAQNAVTALVKFVTLLPS